MNEEISIKRGWIEHLMWCIVALKNIDKVDIETKARTYAIADMTVEGLESILRKEEEYDEE